MTTTLKFDEDWTKKFYSENQIDLNLQIPTENESIKIEVVDMPTEPSPDTSYFSKITATSTKNTDSYLQSILSSPSKSTTAAGSCNGTESCTCYKCQRQRRRAGSNNNNKALTNTKTVANPYTPLKKIENTTQSTEAKNTSSSPPSNNKQTTTTMAPSVIPVAVPTPPVTPSPVSSKPTYKQPVSSVTPVSTTKQVQKQPSITMSPVAQSPVSSPSSTSPVSPKPTSAPNQSKPKRSSTIRKTPTLKSYEKHMPKPVYSQADSIYRIDDNKEERKQTGTKKDLNDILEQKDDYTVSWKEEGTGDDLLSSLVTFQTIFEENGNENEGLSDLLEQRTKELKYQKIREQQQALRPKKQDGLPPKRSDCLTLSYRNGPKHTALTLFHTMKIKSEKERRQAYKLAFQHCINADSGLKSWVKKQRTPPTRESSKLIQAVRKPTVKRSLLHPLVSRRNKTTDEFMLWSASSESLGMSHRDASKRSTENLNTHVPLTQPTEDIIDVISVAHTFLPNQQFSTNVTPFTNKVPYEHIDTPNKPRQGMTSPGSMTEFKDTSSISSSESGNGTSHSTSKLMKGRPGRLLSSLGRKASMKSSKSNRDASIEKMI